MSPEDIERARRAEDRRFAVILVIGSILAWLAVMALMYAGETAADQHCHDLGGKRTHDLCIAPDGRVIEL